MRTEPARQLLTGLRGLIDGVDAGLLVLLAGRRQCVKAAAALKREGGLPALDRQRERRVRLHAQRLERLLGLPPGVGERFAKSVISEAHRQQGMDDAIAPSVELEQYGAGDADPDLTSAMADPSFSRSRRLLRHLPPPQRLAPWLRLVPPRWQARLLETAMARVLAAPLRQGALDALRERRLGIEVSDLGLRWVVQLGAECWQVLSSTAEAEATVRGSATDLLLLASRRADADTLFFQRRLRLTGDTELGLTTRNLLDQLPWEGLPLGLRILMHRSAGVAEAARSAHRGDPVVV